MVQVAEAEKVRKDLLAELLSLVRELELGLVGQVQSYGIAGRLSIFRGRFSRSSITVPDDDIQALQLKGGDPVLVVVCSPSSRRFWRQDSEFDR